MKNQLGFFLALYIGLVAAVHSGIAWGMGDEAALIGALEHTNGKGLNLTRHAGTGAVRLLAGKDARPLSWKTADAASANPVDPGLISPETEARGFLAKYGSLFGVKDQVRELGLKRSRTMADGRSIIRFRQFHQDLPVIGGELVVQLDEAKEILSVTGETSPDPAIDVVPVFDAWSAKSLALEATAKYYRADVAGLHATEPVLSVYNPVLLGSRENRNMLVWQLEVNGTDLAPIREFVLVDAIKGRIDLHFNQIDFALNRIIYDNNNTRSIGLPGTSPVRTEGQVATGIADADTAYDFSGDTYNFYLNTLGRNSINGAGMSLINTVRYCDSDTAVDCPYPNAFWNGQQMVFGDGFASGDDVVGHELTHGVTEYESNLFYYMQSGAINESLSDVFGEFIDLTNGRGNDTSPVRWKMGEDLSVGAIRDMSNPPLFGDPDRMGSANYRCGFEDQGGVHTNSGVNNKAAFLMVDGGVFNGKTVTGIGITKTARIYYEVQTNLLTSGSDYADLYSDLQLACQILSGMPGSGIAAADCAQVKNAVDAVEMNQQPSSCPATEAPLCDSANAVPTNIFFDNLENGGANWTHSAVSGTDPWVIPETGYAAGGTNMISGADNDTISDSSASMTSRIHLPVGAYLHFKHAFGFEFDPTGYYDGGIVEYSTNNGSTWTDAVSLFDHNGYSTSTVYSGYGNPLTGKRAFLGISNGYISSRVNLAGLAGSDVRFRFRIGTDSSYGDLGWAIDDIRIYTCVNDVTAPTGSIIVNSGAASTNSTDVTLTISASDNLSPAADIDMQFSNDNVNWSSWESLVASRNYTLTSGDGQKTVYVRFRDGAGNHSGAFSDSIILDTTTLQVRIPGIGSYTTFQAAYAAAPLSATIQALAVDLVGSFTTDSDKTVALEGGYDNGFVANTGFTSMVGVLTVGTGSITVENLVIK
jgi:Zn-dependent metalloprotease